MPKNSVNLWLFLHFLCKLLVAMCDFVVNGGLYWWARLRLQRYVKHFAFCKFFVHFFAFLQKITLLPLNCRSNRPVAQRPLNTNERHTSLIHQFTDSRICVTSKKTHYIIILYIMPKISTHIFVWICENVNTRNVATFTTSHFHTSLWLQYFCLFPKMVDSFWAILLD